MEPGEIRAGIEEDARRIAERFRFLPIAWCRSEALDLVQAWVMRAYGEPCIARWEGDLIRVERAFRPLRDLPR